MNRNQFIKGKRVKRTTTPDAPKPEQRIKALEHRIYEIKGLLRERFRASKRYLRDENEVRINAPEEVPQNEYLRGHRDAIVEVQNFIKKIERK